MEIKSIRKQLQLMKSIGFLPALTLLLVVLSALVVMAMTAKETAPVSRIGYASSTKLVKSLPETQAAIKVLDSLQKVYTNQFNLKVSEFKTKASAFEKNKNNVNDLVRKDSEAELRIMQSSITRFQQMADSAYKATEQKLMQPVYERVQKAIREVAVQQGYTHIINIDSRDVPLMLYGKKNTNADSLIILQLKEKETAIPDRPTK